MSEERINYVARHVEPSIRVRISHSHTLRDGWRCDSTTVEYDGPIDQYDEDAMQARLSAAYHMAFREANLRNAPQPPEIDGGELDA